MTLVVEKQYAMIASRLKGKNRCRLEGERVCPVVCRVGVSIQVSVSGSCRVEIGVFD